ncbi:Hypothetical predicted protein [Cloeon dipterum]|uniref:Uncharacterized protein n=1 Tax=Cloeon dipterum TaxID=197152 RepID=A0A8S1CHJ0_9INSE|nr:Hypothetical predicted protein [Cloeon dipterum]
MNQRIRISLAPLLREPDQLMTCPHCNYGVPGTFLRSSSIVSVGDHRGVCESVPAWIIFSHVVFTSAAAANWIAAVAASPPPVDCNCECGKICGHHPNLKL